MEKNIQNPGSALGEAVGAAMEEALNVYLNKLATEADCHYINRGAKNPKTGKYKKLLLYDNYATAYNLDGVITNQSLQPLVLVECKYIRYKKHNRDKGSWICAAHPALRKRYHSIRSSIAILAGSWSKTSLAMMKSHDINYFLIPFHVICELLAEYGIAFDWGEKDRDAATRAWQGYVALDYKSKAQIGIKMVQIIAAPLRQLLSTILDENVQRKISKVILEVYTNLGEIRIFECDDFEAAVKKLGSLNCEDIFDVTGAVSLMDAPPSIDINEGEPDDNDETEQERDDNDETE